MDVSRARVIEAATDLMTGRVGLVVGCRRLVPLVVAAELMPPASFDAIRAVESETESYPVGDQRKLFASSYLVEADSRAGVYLEKMEAEVRRACEELIQSLG